MYNNNCMPCSESGRDDVNTKHMYSIVQDSAVKHSTG